MTALVRVLHVTDFHISAPSATLEHLREGFYREYIKQLALVIKDAGKAPITHLVATGDFVDRGAVNHFAHARAVVAELAGSFDLSVDRIVVCNGNHDVVRADDQAGEEAAARAAYLAFSGEYANRGAIEQSPRATLCRLPNDVWAL